MEQSTNFLDNLGPFLLYASIVLAVVVIMLGLSFFLGQRINRKYKNTPFESGIISVGSAQFRISVHFYLTAILFIIFDLEVVFLFAWAVAVREAVSLFPTIRCVISLSADYSSTTRLRVSPFYILHPALSRAACDSSASA